MRKGEWQEKDVRRRLLCFDGVFMGTVRKPNKSGEDSPTLKAILSEFPFGEWIRDGSGHLQASGGIFKIEHMLVVGHLQTIQARMFEFIGKEIIACKLRCQLGMLPLIPVAAARDCQKAALASG
ncbi:hypothetical protein STH12_02171 [Shewanella khirikhana]|uniref:Uncharacterized protein n=1 Tax=Shewanella khirikhana TaxID=1965282 RepID=A0A3Q9E7R3_9GAMM|nr:hypothetical protein STH12_02171 [Shewanella khirikhana]